MNYLKTTRLFLCMILFFSCNIEEDVTSPPPKNFSHLEGPILIKSPIKPKKVKGLSISSSSQKLESYYISVFDWKKREIFNKTIINKIGRLGGEGNYGKYSGFSKCHYFVSMATNEIIRIDENSGQEKARIPAPKGPAYFSHFTTQKGYFLLTHANSKNSKTNLSIYDPQKEEFTKQTIEAPLLTPQMIYDGKESCYDIVHPDSSNYELVSFNLENYTFKKIHTYKIKDPTKDRRPGVFHLFGKDLFISKNPPYRKPQTSLKIDIFNPKIKTFKSSKDIKIDKPYFYLKQFFIYKDELYAIVGDEMFSPRKFLEAYLYKYDIKTNSFNKIESDCLYNCYFWTPLYIRENYLIFIFPFDSEIRIKMVNLDTYESEYNEIIKVY